MCCFFTGLKFDVDVDVEHYNRFVVTRALKSGPPARAKLIKYVISNFVTSSFIKYGIYVPRRLGNVRYSPRRALECRGEVVAMSASSRDSPGPNGEVVFLFEEIVSVLKRR